MTKRQTRLFFYTGTLVFAAVFIGLTIDSHRQFGRLTHEDAITPQVIAGKHVWHEKDCINCHTLLGEGAYYAPDLTHIAAQRGDAYLRAFLKDPSRFYSEEKDRRLMPNQNLSDEQITDLIAFLTWVSQIDTNGWPPRPIRVTGAIQGAYSAPAPGGGTAASGDPVERGQALFESSPPGCLACHSTAPGVVLAGPSLAGIDTRAAQRVRSPDYHGSAKTGAEYIRESILQPNAYLVPGDRFSSEGHSLMPAGFGETLEPAQVDALVAYLTTLR